MCWRCTHTLTLLLVAATLLLAGLSGCDSSKDATHTDDDPLAALRAKRDQLVAEYEQNKYLRDQALVRARASLTSDNLDSAVQLERLAYASPRAGRPA